MDAAVAAGVVEPQAVLIDARRRAGRPAAGQPGQQIDGQVTPVIDIGALGRYDRPAPTLTDYDQLLSGTQA
jgi:hypothetical protein